MADTVSADAVESAARAGRRVVFWSSALLTVLGIAYAGVLGAAAGTGSLSLPPPEPIASYAAIDVIATAILLVVLVVGIDTASPGSRPYSLLAVVFTAMFALAVTINRFIELTIVRQGVSAGDVADLRRFLPYDSHSAMFALEILGWGFFLGLAALCLVPVLRGPGMHRWIAWLFGIYGALGVVSAACLVLDSPMTAIGFVAWGGVLPLAAALMAIAFRPQSGNNGPRQGEQSRVARTKPVLH